MRSFAIETSKLKKVFDNQVVINSINLQIQYGSVTGLLGGNGAGKTTTLSMLLGLLSPTSGSIYLLGHDLETQRSLIAPYINFSSPYVDLPNRLTVRQNLIVYGRLYGIKGLKDRVQELSEKLQITDYLDRRYGSLSAGQRTRASLAKSLLNAPRLLLLDEPTASLDPDTADWVRTFLLSYCTSTGATLFMASHNMREVENMCQDVIVMKAGNIVARGSPQNLINSFGHSNMEEVFLDIARQFHRTL